MLFFFPPNINNGYNNLKQTRISSSLSTFVAFLFHKTIHKFFFSLPFQSIRQGGKNKPIYRASWKMLSNNPPRKFKFYLSLRVCRREHTTPTHNARRNTTQYSIVSLGIANLLFRSLIRQRETFFVFVMRNCPPPPSPLL